LRQAPKFPGEESRHVPTAGVVEQLGIEAPDLAVWVEGQRPLDVEQIHQRTHKKRVALRGFQNEGDEARHVFHFPEQGVREKRLDFRRTEFGHGKLVDGHALDEQFLDGGGERMSLVHFFRAVGCHEHDEAEGGIDRKPLEKLQRGGVSPLPVVQKEHHRMFRLAEDAQEVVENRRKTVRRLDEADV